MTLGYGPTASSSDSEVEERWPRRLGSRPRGHARAGELERADKHPSLGNAPAANGQEKKKKKKRLLPQDSINKTWERFTQPRFTKALTVMPFAPVPAPACGERANELLSAGYERAAEECRQKVRKIIQECKRVNMRYRDRGWDLDWDLKMEKGNCLNRLGRTKWEINMSSMMSPSATVPKAVKRVHEIYEKPSFMENISSSDVKQGSLGDCWIIASFSGLANVKDGIKRLCVEYDTKIGIYGFVFYRDGEWIYSIIDDKLYLKSPCWDSPSMQRDLLQQIDREDVERVYRRTYQTGSKALFFGQNLNQNETWVSLVEKAYAKAHGDYASLSGGWTGEGLEDLSGGVTTELLASDILDTDGFWEKELCKVNEEFLFGCSTGMLDGGYGNRDGISEGHAYIVMETRTLKSGTRLLKLRNPWGNVKKGNWEGAWSDGSKEWNKELLEELGHEFGKDSVFWISYEDLLRKYQHFDRTRLFRDPDWRCYQRWVGVDVPWKAQYHEKFHIRLARESPLVLVLSQLDHRYFRGLQGQYSFRLHFRLHLQDRPDAEDYIVRSHGNYLMDRSVGIELPCMEAGNYSVFISVTGERETDVPSAEEVVRLETKKRVENEKLAQVGEAYNLAHSKAAAHLEEMARARKKTDGAEASEARKKERRRLWEKRHTNRDIQRRQARKNEEKSKARKEAAEAEQKKSEELQPRDRAVQTEAAEDKGEDKSVQTEAAADDKSEASASSSGTPQDTPTSDGFATPATEEQGEDKVPIPPTDTKKDVVSDGPPPAPAQTQPDPKTGAPPRQGSSQRCGSNYSSDGESSDSPVSDWEELYSSDDMSRKPHTGVPPPPTATAKQEEETDDEKDPDPWNAIAIVGLRVYSKDENLELRVIMEGGSPADGGIGEAGGADLDNAQVNAGGEREREKKKKEGEEASASKTDQADEKDYDVIKKDDLNKAANAKTHTAEAKSRSKSQEAGDDDKASATDSNQDNETTKN